MVMVVVRLNGFIYLQLFERKKKGKNFSFPDGAMVFISRDTRFLCGGGAISPDLIMTTRDGI